MVSPSEAGTQASAEADRMEHRGGNGGGGGNGCFPADTPILTPRGWRRIAEIKAGDIVLARTWTGRLAPRPVIRRKDYSESRILSVVSDSGEVLFRITRSDSVLTAQGWRRIDQLQPGDELHGLDERGTETVVKVGRIVDTELVEPVHNLIVARSYNFLVQGCVSHSFTYFRIPRIVASEIWHFISWAFSRGGQRFKWLIANTGDARNCG